MNETVKTEEKKQKPVCIQHVGKVRQFYVKAERILKIYRGAQPLTKGSRFENTIVLNPGCVVDAEPTLAEWLLKKKDFQKYGVK